MPCGQQSAANLPPVNLSDSDPDDSVTVTQAETPRRPAGRPRYPGPTQAGPGPRARPGPGFRVRRPRPLPLTRPAAGGYHGAAGSGSVRQLLDASLGHGCGHGGPLPGRRRRAVPSHESLESRCTVGLESVSGPGPGHAAGGSEARVTVTVSAGTDRVRPGAGLT